MGDSKDTPPTLPLHLEAELEVVPLWIDGVAVSAAGEKTFPVYSAKQEKDVYKAKSAGVDEARRAADAALASFNTWRDTSPYHRQALILKAANIFESRKAEAIKFQVQETSCEATWAGFNVGYGLVVMREIASRVTSVFGAMPKTASHNNLCLVFKEPIGPSLLISPWNAAFVLAVRGICSMLAAGCTVVFKASEHCPRTHYFIAEVFAEAGLPAGALNVIQCRREDAAVVTESLIANDAIRKVEFIGSPAVGKIIGQLGGKYLKPVLMELGGKCAAIVLEDARLENAAKKCIEGAFMHHGQICFSTERIIILESIADKFTKLLKDYGESFAPGSGVSKEIVRNAHDRLVEAQYKGAKFILGGPKYTGPAELLPTIATGITKNMAMFDLETFGPSVSLYIVKDDNEAIAAANDSSFGLNASIHTTNIHRAITIGRRLEFGQVHVNSSTAHNEATFPVGGTKGSGWGRNNSQFGIEEFVKLKTISLNMDNGAGTFGKG